MKHLLIVFLALPTWATAQSIDRHVAASSGNEYNTSVGSMAYTIGEPLTNTLVGGTATFTQGFHQGTINISASARLQRVQQPPTSKPRTGRGFVFGV